MQKFLKQNVLIMGSFYCFEKRFQCRSITVVDSEDDFHSEDKSHKCENSLRKDSWSAATLKVLASLPSRTAGEDSKRGNMSVLN